MSWKLLYVPDVIITPIFIYLLVVIYRSKYDVHHTPFYSFFITSGICGVACLVTSFFGNQMTYSPDQYWILQAIFIINEHRFLGGTIGKFFIVFHRYCVIRQFVVDEKVWSPRLVRFLILIQFFIPTASSIFFIIPGYCDMTVIDENAVIVLATKALKIQKYVNLSAISFYCIACLLLTILSIRRLSSLGRILEGNSRQTVLKQQSNLLMIVSVCCISHIFKALQQFSVLIISFYEFDRQSYLAIHWVTYVLTNDLATYSPAVILLLRSAKIRSLFLRCIRTFHLTSSSTPTPVALQRNP